LETTSTDDIDTLTGLLRSKYGKDSLTTRHIWQQTDESAIELFYKSYDRDFVENLNEVKKGVFRVGVRYYSSDYMKQTESAKTREKSF
jgi:hypothetical protein